MSQLEKAESKTQTDLTSSQRKNGDYPKGKIVLKGIPITIENPKGSIRSGYSPEGVFWKSILNYTYGFIDDSMGSDGDEIDIFLGPIAGSKEDFLVYIISQVHPKTKLFDEYKVMFGFSNAREAREAYFSCYEEGWKGFGSISQISLSSFATWTKTKSNEFYINQLNPKKNEVVADQNERLKLIKLEGEVFEDKTLLDLQNQAGDLKLINTLIMSIASPGGDVSEGIKIMMWLDYLSSIGIKVVTIVTSNAYSIASLIMLAADHTLIAKDADVMVHNPMVPELKLVNANELEEHVKNLRELESTMYDLYEIFTDLSIEEIRELMDNETYLSADEAVRLGFADEIANIKKQPKVMAISKNKILDMKKTLNILNKVIALVGNSNIVNQLYYNDEGGQLEIYQLDPSTYAKGDRTSIENGEVKLQDGSVLTIENFIISSIEKGVPAVEAATPVAPVVPVDPALAPAAAPEAVAGFNVGPAPAAPAEKPAEMKTETTKTETVKTEPVASPVAVVVAPVDPLAVAPVDPLAAPKAVDPIVAPVPEVESPEEEAAEVEISKVEYDALVEMCTKLAERVRVLEEGSGTMKEQMTSALQFEEVATQAIDLIARNTSSNFVPSAKAVVGPAPTGSIFEQAKARAAAAKAAK